MTVEMTSSARLRTVWLAVLVGLLVTGSLAASAPAANAPIAITFVKSFDRSSGSYKGTTGDGGTIEMWVSAPDAPERGETGSMQHFVVRVEATLGNGSSFAAELRGTFNSSTEKTLLTGTVTEGWLAGARAKEQGVHVGGGTFEGTLWLLPASA